MFWTFAIFQLCARHPSTVPISLITIPIFLVGEDAGGNTIKDEISERGWDVPGQTDDWVSKYYLLSQGNEMT